MNKIIFLKIYQTKTVHSEVFTVVLYKRKPGNKRTNVDNSKIDNKFFYEEKFSGRNFLNF